MNQKLSNVGGGLPSVQQPLEVIENLILNIRGKQVMLDRDLARLYGVETKVLNQAVKRNIERFPDCFMFQLTKEEIQNLMFSRSQFVTLKMEDAGTEIESESKSKITTLRMARGEDIKYLPYAFTENGIAMLSGVFNDYAIKR